MLARTSTLEAIDRNQSRLHSTRPNLLLCWCGEAKICLIYGQNRACFAALVPLQEGELSEGTKSLCTPRTMSAKRFGRRRLFSLGACRDSSANRAWRSEEHTS